MDTKSQIGLQDELHAFGLCDGYIDQQNKYNLPIIPKRPNKELEKECIKLLEKSYEKDGLSQQEYNRLIVCMTKWQYYQTQKGTLIHALEYFCKDPHHITAEEYLWCIRITEDNITMSKLQEYADQLSAWYTEVTALPDKKKED